MSEPITYVALILDKSGSMDDTKAAAISGFNEKVQQLKEDSKNQKIFCSVVTFNGDVFEHLWNVPAEQLVEADEANYVPFGGTAMRDAVGYTVQKMINTTDYSDPNIAYLVEVISDGQTNADKHFSPNALKEILASCQSTKKWTITYMGCGEEYLKELSEQTGVPLANMANWSNATDDDAKLSLKNAKTRQKMYFSARVAGSVGTSNYSSNSDNEAANYVLCDMLEEAAIGASAADIVDKDLSAVANNLPKYAEQQSVTFTDTTGKDMFARSNKVQWAE